MSTADATLATDSLTPLHWLGIALAVVSGGIHLWLGVQFLGGGLGIAFLFAGVAFLLGVGAVLIDFRRKTMYLLGVPFTAGQIVLWYYLNFAAGDKAFPADVGGPGAIDKLAQLALIAVLVVLSQRAG
jgi:hypothetical protein